MATARRSQRNTIRYRVPLFTFEVDMRLFELFEGKSKKKPDAPKQRNFVAKNAKTSGAGAHEPKKFSRKEKHKGKDPK